MSVKYAVEYKAKNASDETFFSPAGLENIGSENSAKSIRDRMNDMHGDRYTYRAVKLTIQKEVI